MHFATMGQYWTLWEPAYRGGLPIIFAFMNNFYGMGGQTRGETMGFERLSTIAAGLNRWNFHAETVDGNNPLAVIDAIRRKKEVLAKGEGPVLLDILTYRQSGHSPSDASSYRTREELDAWKAVDAIQEFTAADPGGSGGPRDGTGRDRGFRRRADPHGVPVGERPHDLPAPDGTGHRRGRCSPRRRPNLCRRSPRTRCGSRTPRTAGSSRSPRSVAPASTPPTGERLSESKAVSFRDAIFEAVIHHAYHDPRLVIYGEENRDWDGAFAVYRGLTESLPYHRLFNAPISEGAIVGTAVGYAMEGGRPLVELMYCDFLGRAGDEIFNQLSKWQAMSAGVLRMPVVLRVSVGSKYGAQHSQDWSAMTAHIPGLKVVFPATPYDAKGLMTAALAGNDPVVFFESQRLYGITEWFQPEVPAEYVHRSPRRAGGEAPRHRPHHPHRRLDAVPGRRGRRPTAEGVRPVGRGHRRPEPGAVRLRPRARVGARRPAGSCSPPTPASEAAISTPWPPTSRSSPSTIWTPRWSWWARRTGSRRPPSMEDLFFPQPSWLLDAVHTQLRPLPGYRPTTDCSPAARLRAAREGV